MTIDGPKGSTDNIGTELLHEKQGGKDHEDDRNDRDIATEQFQPLNR